MEEEYSMLRLLPYVLSLMILFALPATSTTLRAHLTHVDHGRGFTKGELLRRMVARSRARAAKLCPSGRNGAGISRPVTAPVGRGVPGDLDTEYLIHFSIGAPRSQPVALTLDTGSDLIWTQCLPCAECFPQPFPAFDTSASGTVRTLACSDPLCGKYLSNRGCFVHGCTYIYRYGDGSVTYGHAVRDAFTFLAPDGRGGKVTVPDLAFGCGLYTTGLFGSNESGIAGFGRGTLSLPAQLKVRKFSYCFTRMFESKISPVFLGTPDDIRAHATGPIQSTPLIPNPADPDSSFYFLTFKGVTVGKTRLPVPESAFAIKPDGSGGAIIDSGTGMTRFPQAVFRQLNSAFEAQVPLPVYNSSDGDMPCFSTASVPDAKKVPVPRLVFHLDGADWDLPRENYVGLGPNPDELCVMIHTAGGSDETIIGNFQQQNMHVIYDLAMSKLHLVPAQCDKM